jgi:hypothetical protein
VVFLGSHDDLSLRTSKGVNESVARKFPKLLKLLLNIAMISLVALSLAEITLRLCHKIYPLYIFYENSYNRFRGKPFAEDYDFRLNSRGFKDLEGKKEKGPTPTGTWLLEIPSPMGWCA